MGRSKSGCAEMKVTRLEASDLAGSAICAWDVRRRGAGRRSRRRLCFRGIVLVGISSPVVFHRSWWLPWFSEMRCSPEDLRPAT